ncbi:hypothetical protein Bca4012_062731 [Brassica carinata]|uniref:Uncharacterized protein n=1 Tax=Brassica carinata TaxID=52824 RepID=A0A8X7QKS6_BRACI|nr:hypothetical protein Bca52824_064273 [Brassica carinata]
MKGNCGRRVDNKTRGVRANSEDFASRLYLIEIHSGLSEAEKFFKTIPENMKDDLVYTALLSFYTKSKKTRHDAEATYQKIGRKLEENRVVHDKNLTSNNVLKAYASVPDVEAMEKFLKRIEDETTPFALAWQTGISMAGLI